VIKKVKKAYREVFSDVTNEDLIKRIKFLPNESDLESYLLASGYQNELLNVIDQIEGTEGYLNHFITLKDGTERKRVKTEKICPTCEQNIFEAPIRVYSGDKGYQEAILDYLESKKTEYSSMIGCEILKRNDKTKIPEIIREMFYEISNVKNLAITPLYLER
ncbi:TPA: ATP-dependent endonuclease, partial [Enterococcus faecalis]|nr:ATP-dependent endonuclease [Enterococcus faecalis]